MKNLKQILSSVVCSGLIFAQAVSAEISTFYKGDFDNNGVIDISDITHMCEYLCGKGSTPDSITADITGDDRTDIADLVALRAEAIGQYDMDSEDGKFIDAPVAKIETSLSSQGEPSLVIFCVEFPDCKYSRDFTAEMVDDIAFGDANEESEYFPFESMTAFYERSSKGVMHLTGRTFRYTAQNPISYYTDDLDLLAYECFKFFEDSVDFKKYDTDDDGVIDASLFAVPESADENYWWPYSIPFSTDNCRIDGLKIGHMITGNVAPYDVVNFNSSYLHEMGHCMGIPDYYLYYSEDDYEGMNGNAGPELMDADAFSDFGAFSKLMLGWYRKEQINVFEKSMKKAVYKLHDAQSENGNCIIIPHGKPDKNYFSEYMIIEYITENGNNSVLNTLSWQSMKPGIRIMHIKADFVKGPWWNYFKYENGSEETGYDDEGIRLLRLVNDGKDPFDSGDIIDSSVSGFGWYDVYGNEKLDVGVKVHIGEIEDDCYTITVSCE